MEYKITKAAPEQQAAGMLVLGLLPKLQPSAAIKRLPPQTQEWIGAILKQGDLPDKAGKSLLLHQVPGLKAERLLLLAQGEKAQISARDFLSIIRSVIGQAKATTAKSLLWSLDGLEVAGHDQAWMVRQIILGAETARYQYQATKGSNKPDDKQKLKKITLQRSDLISPSQCEQLINQSSAMAHGVALARELGNLPPNLCTPSYLADQAKQLAQAHDALSLKVLNAKEMKALGMGALLAVAAGSAQPPKLIILEYRGAAENSAPHVLVGKGITFDSGGISLKPGAAMDEMKFDMCGAASVLGVMQAIAELKAPINLVGIIAASENLPSGTALKPGDVITSLSGKTIEVLNTDAEGRLVLCDALTYAERYNPKAVIDIATLTGACVVALGHHASGLFSNDQALTAALTASGEATHDRLWSLPLWKEYEEALESNFADLANVGGRSAGSITAACFLSRFTEKYPWAHIDIAGTAWISGGKEKGATGRPVPALLHYLLDQAVAQP